LKDALSHSNKAIAIDPSFAPAYLTRATVNAAIDIQSDEVRADLEHAIRLDKTLKPFVAEQSVLHSLYNYEWFQLLVGGEKEKAV
jgi:tetratricopeptide (TPR) repeat protein